MSNKSGITDQVISLPKGGGALKGIGEMFAPDLHTGTGNFTIPLSLPPGRNGFQPQLSLVYSTGNGMGAFGLGWNLSIPGISRKTSHGLPRYDDREDTFILSGAEELVPVSVDEQLDVTRYRPRTEGLFARTSHYRDQSKNYWEVRSKDGLMSFYGAPRPADSDSDWQDPAVIADPDNPAHIFAWKLTETKDLFGNRIVYSYERDSSPSTLRKWDQLYLQEIKYVDYVSLTGEEQFLVTVKFEYETIPDRYPDHLPVPDSKRIYPASDNRAGFEIRTRRRCKRIVIRTHAEQDRLVRVYNFIYLDQRPEKAEFLPLNGISLLSQFEVIGYDDHGVPTRELPPLEFGYTRFEPGKRHFFPIAGPDLPPASFGHPQYEVADLFGNGLPDVLEMNGGTVRYWRNLGEGKLDRLRTMHDAPGGLQLADPGVQLIDANGDGRIDLLVTSGALSGYFPARFGGCWDRRSFQRYPHAPSFNLEDPEVKLIDLNGDGVTDAIRSGSRLECFFNDPKQGWKESRWIERQSLEKFSGINFSDPRVKWGDMTGDGLQDMVLVYDGNVEYLPNLGYGNWSEPVSMQNCPKLSYGYDPKRILVGDVDGDGIADMVYVDDTKVVLWINQSGCGWSDPIEITGTPRVTDLDSVRLIDMLGNGISGVLWTSDSSALSRHSMFFLDFTGRIKPYLLNEMDNQIGSLTRVKYGSSINYFLEDEKRPETQWRAPLPFPVQVVAKVEVIDQISNCKLTTEYSYHHGYWDGAEREFRGFGRVDQRDTEAFEHYHSEGLYSDRSFEQVAAKVFAPPLETRTWFHQGPVGDEFGDWEEPDPSNEFWSGDPQAFDRTPVAEFLENIEERRVRRDALRSLRGSILRTELYALDGTELQSRPYTVTETLYGLREESLPEPDAADRKRIFFAFKTAERITQWERGNDPMTKFAFMGSYDEYGHPLEQISIAVPRGRNYREAAAPDSENPYLSAFAVTDYAKRDDEKRYIVDRVARMTNYEVINDGSLNVFQLWEAVGNGSASKRVIGQTHYFYDGPAFQGMPFGQLGEYGALVRTENLVLTQDILREAYRSGNVAMDPPEHPPYLVPANPIAWNSDYPEEFQNRLPSLAGYNYEPDGMGLERTPGYYVTAERRRYDFHSAGDQGRGLILTSRDPLGRDTDIRYDTPYRLLPVQVTDPIGLQTQAKYNYRILQPDEVTDPNNNKTKFVFTPSGLLKAAFVQGKAVEGDRQRPSVRMEYDFLAFKNNGQPIFVRTFKQIHHDTDIDVPLPERDETITTVEYSDGFGRLVQTRTQAEDITFGDTVYGDAGLPADQSAPNQAAIGHVRCPDRGDAVVVSGWQTYDNKGRVVEKYEPFFACGWAYAKPTSEQLGQKLTNYYDPRGQVIRTVNPDGSEQRVIYGIPADLAEPDQFTPTPWEAYTYDANDLAPLSYHPAELLPDRSPKPLTAYAPAHHQFTPVSIKIDALGRTIESIGRNRLKPSNPGDPLPPIEVSRTFSTYDIRGNVLTVTDALGRIAFRYVYDLANRILRTESIDAGIRRTILDAVGNSVEQRDSKGALILQSYDVMSRLSHVWARDGTGQGLTLRGRLIYGDGSDHNQPVAERDANRTANRLGKLYRHYDEAGLLTLEAYDFKGNVIEKVRQVIRDDRIASVFDDAAANNWQVQPYRVDWQSAGGINLENHAHDLLDSSGYRTSVTYDALNRVKILRYPQDVDGERKELKPEYNRAGALVKVALDDVPYVNQIAYNAKGQRVLIAYGNGIMTRHAYDPITFHMVRLRTERYTNHSGTSTFQPDGGLLQDFAYRYDLIGNLYSIQDRTPESGVLHNPEAMRVGEPELAQLLAAGDALVRHFEYDALYRLSSATGRECDTPPQPLPWMDQPRCTDMTRTRLYEENYRYDQAGNMKQLLHIANGNRHNRDFAPAEDHNRLASMAAGQSVIPYSYDENGNLTQEAASRHFEWDYADRMRVYRTQTGNAEPSQHAHYLYDGGGQRVKKLVRKQGGQIEVTIYIDGMFEYQRIVRVGAVEENNTLLVMDNQSRIALVRVGNPFAGDVTPAVKYHLGDHLGSSNLVIDNLANWVNREEFTPYGESSFGSFARKRYRFTGKERDEESGLYYFGARYYMPWIGRWISCDPLGMVDGTNLYRYARNDPIRYVDPYGTQSIGVTNCAGSNHHTERQSQAPSIALDSPPLSEEQIKNWTTPTPKTDQSKQAPTVSVTPAGPRVAPPGAFDKMGGPKQEKSKADNVAENIQKGMVTVLSLGDTFGINGMVLSIIKGGLKEAGFSNTELEALDTYLAMEGQGGMQAFGQAGTGLKAWIGSGLAKKQTMGVLKAPAFMFMGAGGIGGGFTARAPRAETLTLTRNFTAEDLAGVSTFRESLFVQGEEASVAGTLAHEAAGARGAGQGVDYVKYNGAFLQDLKFSGMSMMEQRFLDKAATQTLNYSIQYQQRTGLTPIRSVKYIWVSPTEAVKAVF